MADVTDYKVIRKPGTGYPDFEEIKFSLPKTIDVEGEAVLYFVLSISGVDGSVKLRIRLNGTQVWKGTFGAISRWGTFHAIVPANVLKGGSNKLNIDMWDWEEGDLQIYCQVSEILIFFKRVK
jgi:hypothetical protein